MTPYRVAFTGREWFSIPGQPPVAVSLMTAAQLKRVALTLPAKSPTRLALLRWHRKRLLQ
jgi:hypothetical protein